MDWDLMSEQIVRHVEECLPRDHRLSVVQGEKSPVALESTSGDTPPLSLGSHSWREKKRYTYVRGVDNIVQGIQVC